MMAARIDQFGRAALITALIDKSPSAIGRTALMKCMYFLQELADVPLGYHFSLYTYGPFDSDVLNDLGIAERMGAVESRIFHFPGGHGYELHRADTDRLLSRSEELVSRYVDAIGWVIQEFGSRSALDLEMASTLVYVDRSAAEEGSPISAHELVRKVRNIKPHLDIRQIEQEARCLAERELISARS
jgi:uncharacterized protein